MFLVFTYDEGKDLATLHRVAHSDEEVQGIKFYYEPLLELTGDQFVVVNMDAMGDDRERVIEYCKSVSASEKVTDLVKAVGLGLDPHRAVKAIVKAHKGMLQ